MVKLFKQLKRVFLSRINVSYFWKKGYFNHTNSMERKKMETLHLQMLTRCLSMLKREKPGMK